MSARADSDEDGGGKAITKKETRLLLAINSAESMLIESMTQEMLNGERRFDAETFVEVFRKYTPHFVQMLTGEDSSDSEEDDEFPLPKKYLPFLAAFTKSRDKFVTAIQNNYKVLCKKDLKDINFSVFKSHPEEIFKSYAKSIGRMTQQSPVSHYQSLSNAHQLSNSLHNEEMNVNDVSVDTDHGSLLSAQEEELRRTIESESDTPTPTIEDWKGAKERRRSNERAMNKTPTVRPDAVPLMVSLANHSSLPQQHLSTHSKTIQPTMSSTSNPFNSHPPSTITPSLSTVPQPMIVPSLASSAVIMNTTREESSKGGSSLGLHIKEDPTRTEKMGTREISDVEKQITMIIHGLKETMREVHQDLRFALHPMMERAVKAYFKEKRPLTLSEFIGEEYADDKLMKFMVKMLSKDQALMRICRLECTSNGDRLVHINHLNPMKLEECKENVAVVGGEEEVKKEDDGKAEQSREEEAVVPAALWRLEPMPQEEIKLFPEAADLPLTINIKEGESSVNIAENGIFAVIIDKWSESVNRQLSDLCHLDMDHLNLSNAHLLEKGTIVMLKTSEGYYCRGVIKEKWTRESNGIDTPVKCFLIDFGQVAEIPIISIYTFPKWCETMLPATTFFASLGAYPIGATKKTDKYSQSVWENIVGVLSEWHTKSHLALKILGRDGEKAMIDVMNGEEKSLRDELVKRGIVQMELTPLPSNSSLSPSISIVPQNGVSFGTGARDLPLTPKDEEMKDEMKETGGETGWKEMVKIMDSCPSIHLP
ncbi:hypothetical protein PENTCL1PPCAC_22906 [Pristionchus entomophagus]|uniref:Tudor domain-containing protein n=1 Tax=Pristionchus entomophagus TaxID=358040 RepID=A0AAV5U2R9_9BILA|nr:hypothetical protein PENTCL1PPCAC_22906 [Pristionchus entomophagus]